MNNVAGGRVAVVGGARTPFAKAGTRLKEYTSLELGTHAVNGALQKLALDPVVIDQLVYGVVVVDPSIPHLARDDEDISAAIQAILEGEGVRFELGAECISFSRQSSGIEVAVSCKRVTPRISGSHVLLAVGRVPNTDDLGLEAAGIAVNAHGYIPVDDQLRTNVENVWALGDGNGRGAFTHTAYNDFEIVAANLFSNNRRSVKDRIDNYGLFIDPPLGRVGLTERGALDAGYKLRVGKRPMTLVGRAREFGETQGLMKVVVDADTDRILGAAILGLNGDEAIHGIVDIMNADLPYTSIQRSVHIHPTVSELIPTVLGDLQPPDSSTS